MKKGKSARVDNIPAELAQAGGEDVITALTTICNKIWQTGKWPTLWTQSLVITLPKKGNLQQCQNYRTISLIGHPSKVMEKKNSMRAYQFVKELTIVYCSKLYNRKTIGDLLVLICPQTDT